MKTNLWSEVVGREPAFGYKVCALPPQVEEQIKGKEQIKREERLRKQEEASKPAVAAHPVAADSVEHQRQSRAALATASLANRAVEINSQAVQALPRQNRSGAPASSPAPPRLSHGGVHRSSPYHAVGRGTAPLGAAALAPPPPAVSCSPASRGASVLDVSQSDALAGDARAGTNNRSDASRERNSPRAVLGATALGAALAQPPAGSPASRGASVLDASGLTQSDALAQESVNASGLADSDVNASGLAGSDVNASGLVDSNAGGLADSNASGFLAGSDVNASGLAGSNASGLAGSNASGLADSDVNASGLAGSDVNLVRGLPPATEGGEEAPAPPAEQPVSSVQQEPEFLGEDSVVSPQLGVKSDLVATAAGDDLPVASGGPSDAARTAKAPLVRPLTPPPPEEEVWRPRAPPPQEVLSPPRAGSAPDVPSQAVVGALRTSAQIDVAVPADQRQRTGTPPREDVVAPPAPREEVYAPPPGGVAPGPAKLTNLNPN